MAKRANDAWASVENVVRSLIDNKELAGQALLSEARRVDAVDMDAMHALVALREWVERTLAPGSAAQVLTLAPTEAERDVAQNALDALERVAGVAPSSASLSNDPGASRSIAAVEASSDWAPPKAGTAAPRASARAVSPVGDARSSANTPTAGIHDEVVDAPPRNKVSSSGLIMAAIAIVAIIGAAGAWYALKGSAGSGSTDEGVAAYTRGSKEAARLAFVKAIEKNPQDVRALTYLGRINRELGNLATARKYLDDAIRTDPKNALALREFASALLADEQPELARRFYVRALEVDGNDRVAQGFLGCALMRLDRKEEAERWLSRAGAGDWVACANAAPATNAANSKD